MTCDESQDFISDFRLETSHLLDAVIAGAGPAGSVAAIVLARAGVRVRLIDRATFPRDKLCGDTVNPGTLALLGRLGVASAIEARGLPIDGMRLTGEGGAAVEGRYPAGVRGRALLRRDLDWVLLQAALAAGAEFEPGVAVRRASLASVNGRPTAYGVVVGANGSAREMRARLVVAADGRRSSIAFGLGLARHPARPRRWAIGAYYDRVGG